MKCLAVLVALCLVPSLVWAAPRKRARPENYGTMRIQAAVFKRLIKLALPLSKDEPTFLGRHSPYAPFGNATGVDVVDPAPRVKSWVGHEGYVQMQSKEDVFKRRLAKKYHARKYAAKVYGGTYVTIEDIKWITPQIVEVEASILKKDWVEAGMSTMNDYTFKLRNQNNKWSIVSEEALGGAG